MVLTLSLILLTIVYFLLYRHFKKKLNYFKDLNIPYVPAWPILGNLGSVILRRQAFQDLIKEIYNVDREALYVGLFDLMRPTILLRDPELIKSISIKNFDHFTDRALEYNKSDRLWNESIFGLSYEKWRETRNVISPMFSIKKIKGMFDVSKDCAFSCVDYLSKRSAEENRMIDTKDLLSRCVNDSLLRCMLGVYVNSYKDLNNEPYMITKRVANFEDISLKIFLARGVPGLLEFLKVKIIDDRWGNFYKHLVSTVINSKESSSNSSEHPDMIQLMMDAREKTDGLMDFDLDQMTAQVIINLVAGLETTTLQICCVAHELALNPEVQKKLQQEIYSITAVGDYSYDSIMNNTPYLEAVICETNRMHTVSSVFDRVCVKEFVLPPALPGCKPFVVKPGMPIWVSAGPIHRDSRHFEEPDTFNPDRYFMKKINPNDGVNLAFGLGPRACFGKRFALMAMKTTFFYILQKYDFKPNEKTVSHIKCSTKSINLLPEGGFWVSLTPRNNSQ